MIQKLKTTISRHFTATIKVALSGFWGTIPFNFERLVYHSERSNRNPNPKIQPNIFLSLGLKFTALQRFNAFETRGLY